MISFTGMLLIGSVLASPSFPVAQRLRPPERLPCELNQLTSFTGRVTFYERKAESTFIRLRTDEETDEQFTVRHTPGEPPAKWFLVWGAAFSENDWKKIESEEGRLLPRMRITVWVCEKAPNPVFDWRPPREEP